MEVLALCPGNLATGGTEGIHNLVRELGKHRGISAKILYVQGSAPEEFSEYGCEYVTELPADFSGCVIFPEVWANWVIDPKFKACTKVINWQGWDVYDWNVPQSERGLYRQCKDAIHICGSEYAKENLQRQGIEPIKISDCINEAFFHLTDTDKPRKNTILYNPTSVKLTQFQRTVMARCTTELGYIFQPLSGYTRNELIGLFQKSKLYIDFGVFSGRERLPREAVMCGCCILTSKSGTAGYYEDNPIPNEYKVEDVNTALDMIQHIIRNYEDCKKDFNYYRQALRDDIEVKYPKQVKELADAILNHHPSI